MACSTFLDFSMENQAFFDAMAKIGVKFSDDECECTLKSGETYEFCFEDGYDIPDLGFGDEYMIGMYLDYFLGCGNSDFCYAFMKILTENGFFESNYDFETNPFDEDEDYDEDFYSEFRMTKKLTDFDGTIEAAYVEGIYYDGEVTAFRAVVSDGIMTIHEIQCNIEGDLWGKLDEFWDTMKPEELEEFAICKTLRDGRWVKVE